MDTYSFDDTSICADRAGKTLSAFLNLLAFFCCENEIEAIFITVYAEGPVYVKSQNNYVPKIGFWCIMAVKSLGRCSVDRFGFIHEKLDIKILILFILQRLPKRTGRGNTCRFGIVR
jgi:hypothetical protein